MTGLNFSRILRVDKSAHFVVSFVGAGGKTTALFQLAHELAKDKPVLVTSSTHLGAWQIPLADCHSAANRTEDVQIPEQGVYLVTGETENNRTKPVSEAVMKWLHAEAVSLDLPLLVEADGSRRKPLKAPAAHEPPIPNFSDLVVHVTGLSALGKLLTEEQVYEAEIFSRLSGLSLGDPVTPQAVTSVLTHPQGGLKNIPPRARRVALLNQADTAELQSVGGSMARELLGSFDFVIVGSLQGSTFEVFERA
jgi:molybdenum cofactor cytidylyltransferase